MTCRSLDGIARDAACAAGNPGARVLLVQRCGKACVGGAWGVIWQDREELDDHESWDERTVDLGHGALAVVPLRIEDRVVGALEVFSADPESWSDDSLKRLRCFAADTAPAVLRSRSADRQCRRLDEIQHLVQVLREENHEHANRLHAVAALIAMGEEREARRFAAELMRIYDESLIAAVEEIGNEALTGFLTAESAAARRQGTLLEVDARGHLAYVPGRVSGAALLRLAGSLLDYAFEGIADVPPARRHVVFAARDERRDVILQARDFGDHDCGDAAVQPLSECLLRDAVRTAQGALTVEAEPVGTVATVHLPA